MTQRDIEPPRRWDEVRSVFSFIKFHSFSISNPSSSHSTILQYYPHTPLAKMYSVIVLGATGVIGVELAHELSVQKSHFKRVAFLTPLADAGPEKEARYTKVEQQLERVVGSLSDPASYKGFDIVISVVGDALCAQQHEFIDAAFQAGVKHFFPGECKFTYDLKKERFLTY